MLDAADPATPTLRHRTSRLAAGLRRALLRRRRLLAALCVAVAVAAGLRAYAPPPPPTVEVTVAAHDLAAGTELTAGHLTTVQLPGDAVPAGALTDPAGRTLAAPLGAGEPVTRARVVGAGLTTGTEDLVATPVRLPDAGMVDLLRTGDRIDLIATDPRGTDTAAIATGVPVLAVPAADAGGPHGTTGRLVVVGLEPEAIPAVTAATVASVVTFTWAPG